MEGLRARKPTLQRADAIVDGIRKGRDRIRYYLELALVESD